MLLRPTILAKTEGIQIILSGVNPKVHQTLSKAGINKSLGEEFICSHISLAVAKAYEVITRNELIKESRED